MVVQRAKKSGQKRTDGVHSTVYKAVEGELLDIRLDHMMVPVMASINPVPQFMQVWSPITDLHATCDTVFGKVPQGSLLSYQLQTSKITTNNIVIQGVALPPPFSLPVLESTFFGPLSYECECLFHGLSVTKEQALDYEEITRDQSKNKIWHDLRAQRITASNFKQICSRRSNFDTLVQQLRHKTIQTAAMKRGIELEPAAAETYSRTFGRNTYDVGFVINPTAYHLGCTPDRRVYDPEAEGYGLLEIKCPAATYVAHCKYLLTSQSKERQLSKSHQYYYQVMGQMGLTGAAWCDFFVYTTNDYHCERIAFDSEFFNNMVEKLDHFYFNFFLPAFL